LTILDFSISQTALFRHPCSDHACRQKSKPEK